MRRKLILLPLAMPIALFVGCEGTAPNDPTSTTDSALESCFATSGDGSTKCALQGGSFSRDPQDMDHDGRPDSFVCAHIVKVPHGWMGAGGSSGAAPADPSGGARPPLPPVPADADCDHLGCQDQRGNHGGPGAGHGGADGNSGPPSTGPGAPASADIAPTARPAGAPADDMKCPGHDGQGPGQGAGGAGAPAGHGPGEGHGAGGAGAAA